MSHYKYVVTAQKPTAVQFAVKGSFTSPYETNLILGKGSRIEVYAITPDGLKSTIDFSIHGTIIALRLYIPQGRDKASLFLITSRYKHCVLSYDSVKQQIITESNGEIGYPGQPRREALNTNLTIDPSCRYFATTLYDSTVTIIIPDFTKPREFTPPQTLRKTSIRSKEGRKRQTQDTTYPTDYINMSLPDKQVISIAFLQDVLTESTLLILYDDALGRRYLQAFTIDLKSRKLVPGNIVMDHFESDANQLITMPPAIGGVVLIAGKFIRYLKPNHPPVAVGIRPSTINSFSIMNDEGSRLLLGDAEGMLHLLTLTITNRRVEALCFIGLGNISIPSCLVYLDNDVIFVGSSVGDSQLIHVQRTDTTAAENGEILEVIDEFSNIGPITDFCVADLDKQGQTQLITCSGVAKDSSLRIVRNGVGLNELAVIDISGVKGVWALRPSFYDKHDDVLLISFVNQTRLLALRDNAMTQLEAHSGIDLNCRTLVAANVKDDMIIQVTDRNIRLMEANGSNGSLLDEWFPDDNISQITVASVNPSQCVISIGYGRLLAFAFKEKKLELISTTQLPNEISCIDISPIQSENYMESKLVAVGMWQNVGVCLLSLPDLRLIAEEKLAGIIMPRSILMAQFENICYLLVALGDGQFYNFKLDTEQGTLSDKKRSFLGKLPIQLSTFTSNGTTHVFAASDKPSVIHSRNNKLIYSNVNLREVRCATSFNSLFFPDAVALITKNGLVIGQMEEIQKLHITKIPTQDTPRRIVYQEKSKTFGIVTERITSESYTSSTTTGGFEILDDQTFDVLDRLYFKHFERPLATTSMTFENDSNEYYILATGKETDEYESRSIGRIIVLQVTSERKLRVISQIKTDGMTDCIRPFEGKLLASVRGMIYVYKWENVSGFPSLVPLCSQRVPSITECMTSYKDSIVTGDMVYSIVNLRFDAKTQTLLEVAAHEKLKEILAIEAINENFYVAAEREGHLFVVEKCNDDTLNDEPLLETVSIWHLGDSVRKLRFGSLGMNNSDPDRKPEAATTLIFATASGAIGLITDISVDRFKLLNQIQYNMAKAVQSIGNLSHIDWRSVSIMDRKDQATNFIDGDLIESFLDLTPQQMQAVVDGQRGGRKLDKSVEDICKVVEELMSAHP